MTSPLPASLVTLEQRWTSFLERVRGRVGEIEREALAAYVEVVALNPVDGTGPSGVSSALRARLLAIGEKVSDGWSTIDAELDRVVVDDARAPGRLRDALLAHKARLDRWLAREAERILVEGEAHAGRALQAAARQEVGLPSPCAQCGAALERPIWHQAVNVTCPYCRALNTMTPGTAASMFAAAGARWIARHEAFPAWCAMQEAEVAWHSLRHKSRADLARWEAANRAYWQAFAEAMGRLHPGWTPKHVADEVTGKMSWFLQTVTADPEVGE